MRRWGFGLLLGWLLLPWTLAAETAMQWGLTGDRAEYSLQGGGDVRSDKGASLSVHSLANAGKGFGGGIIALDAAPYRGMRVILSGKISTQDVQGMAGLWLRADGVSGSLSFANTQGEPVSGDADNVSRYVEITVPAEARQLLLGPLLSGRGRMSVAQLRLQVAGDAKSNAPPVDIVKSAISIMRKHALHADRIDWVKMQPEFIARMATATEQEDAYVAIEELIRALDDKHSLLLRPASAQRYAQQGVPSSSPSVSVRDGVGFVVVPGFSGTSAEAGQAFASKMENDIAGAASSVKCGWVVDLRGNPGGNMWPMLSGLSPLLGSEPTGFFRDSKGQEVPWRLSIPNAGAPDFSAARVAVLTGAKTASSGEAITVAFRGRPNTRSFGLPTAGLSTANQQFKLPGGAQLGLTTSRFVDRTGRVYGEKIVPDQLTAEPEQIEVAKAWLTANEQCH